MTKIDGDLEKVRQVVADTGTNNQENTTVPGGWSSSTMYTEAGKNV